MALRAGSEIRRDEAWPEREYVRIARVDRDVELADVGSALRAHGVKPERRNDISPSLAQAMVFTDPNGTEVELYTDAKLVDSRPVGGVAPLKLGHIACLGPDAKAISVTMLCNPRCSGICKLSFSAPREERIMSLPP